MQRDDYDIDGVEYSPTGQNVTDKEEKKDKGDAPQAVEEQRGDYSGWNFLMIVIGLALTALIISNVAHCQTIDGSSIKPPVSSLPQMVGTAFAPGAPRPELIFLQPDPKMFKQSVMQATSNGNRRMLFSLRDDVLVKNSFNYVIAQEPQSYRATGYVPVRWSEGWLVPRPTVISDPTVVLVYQNVCVYKNGLRLKEGLDYRLLSGAEDQGNQVGIVPTAIWTSDDVLLVDYVAVFPLAPIATVQ